MFILQHAIQLLVCFVCFSYEVQKVFSSSEKRNFNSTIRYSTNKLPGRLINLTGRIFGK